MLSRRPFFLRREWIGAGEMVTGLCMAGYGFVEIVRYPKHGPLPPILGETQMAFSTAVCVFFSGLAWYWNGLDKRLNGYQERSDTPLVFTSADVSHIIAALISALAAAFVSWIAIQMR